MKRWIFILLIMINTFVSAQESNKEPFKNNGFIDFNGYYDSREFSVLTINMLANLKHGFQYFSLTNYEGPSKSSDLSSYYSEHNVRYKLGKSAFDVTLQYVMRNGIRNDDLRLGMRWRVNNTKRLKPFFEKINMRLSINPMFIQFREATELKYNTIIEHVYNIKILPKALKNRVYIGGFVDQNFIYKNDKVTMEFVTEHQLGFELLKNFFAVCEYRVNTFLPTNPTGIGYGMEYKVIF